LAWPRKNLKAVKRGPHKMPEGEKARLRIAFANERSFDKFKLEGSKKKGNDVVSRIQGSGQPGTISRMKYSPAVGKKIAPQKNEPGSEALRRNMAKWWKGSPRFGKKNFVSSEGFGRRDRHGSVGKREIKQERQSQKKRGDVHVVIDNQGGENHRTEREKGQTWVKREPYRVKGKVTKEGNQLVGSPSEGKKKRWCAPVTGETTHLNKPS